MSSPFTDQKRPSTQDLVKGVDIIYYINMPRSTDRREYIELMLSKPMYEGIPIERIRAMDGKTEPIEDFLHFRGVPRIPHILPTEYGCTISHIRAIHEFAKTDLPVALVLEDDASDEFAPMWTKTIEQHLRDAPADWEVLQLSYIPFEYLPIFDYEKTEMRKNLCGTAAYLIKNAAARRLIHHLCDGTVPRTAAISQTYTMNPGFVSQFHQADRFLYEFFKTYTLRVPPFTYRDQNDSAIRPEHNDFHCERKEMTRDMYMI